MDLDSEAASSEIPAGSKAPWWRMWTLESAAERVAQGDVIVAINRQPVQMPNRRWAFRQGQGDRVLQVYSVANGVGERI